VRHSLHELRLLVETGEDISLNSQRGKAVPIHTGTMIYERVDEEVEKVRPTSSIIGDGAVKFR
jgi:hypothetical protein